MRIFVLVCLLLSSLTNPLVAQFSSKTNNELKPYFEGIAFFNSAYYTRAEESFKSFTEQYKFVNNPQTDNQVREAELYIAKCALYQNSPQAEQLFVAFINKNKPSPQSNEALFELANYYFEGRNYDLALKYYDQLEIAALGGAVKNEAHFKKGYSLFIKKKYPEATQAFSAVSQSEYYPDANYFAGHSQLELGNHERAIAYWKQATSSKKYEQQIPYTIAQIYFANKEYDQLVAYAQPYLGNNRTKNDRELRQLVGKSYFELGQFDKANPLLEDYAEQRGRMNIEDYYQLGYTRYLAGEYQKATEAFVKLDDEKSARGQSAMYYLADCYTNLGDKPSARNAFYRVSKLGFDKDIQQEALLNYAKISAESGYDIEAIKALLRFRSSSKYYDEAQEMVVEVLERTKDTKRALSILEKLDDLSPELQRAYQVVAYRQGELELSLNNPNEAKDYFNSSLNYTPDRRLHALANYWMSEILFSQRNYEESRLKLDVFFALSPDKLDLPAKSSLGLSYYNQAYNLMKLEDFGEAERYFKASFKEIPQTDLPQQQIVDLVSDAGLRLADCYFKRKSYNDALNIYRENISKGYKNSDYAQYQAAVIYGLQQQLSAKISALEALLASSPNSTYADDALLELGNTYGEIGEQTNALRSLERLVNNYSKKSPLLPAAYLELGLINYNLEEVDLALDYYKKVFDHNPSSEEARNALAAIQEIYMVDKKDPDSYIAYAQSVTGSRTSSAARDSLNYKVGYTLYEEGQYSDAIRAFDDYLLKFKRGLNRNDANFYKAESHSILKEYEKAVKAYEACINAGQSPYFEDCLEKAAKIHYNYTGDFSRAYRYYTELDQLTANDDIRNEAQIGAFRSAYRLGQEKETIIYANKVIKNPKASNELKLTAQFYLGKIDYDRKQYSSAHSYLEPVASNGSGENQAEARYLIANIAFQLEQMELAQELTQTAMKENGAYPIWIARSLILHSDILVVQKDYFNAKAALDALIENFSDNQEILNEARRKRQAIIKLEEKENSSQIDNGSSDGN